MHTSSIMLPSQLKVVEENETRGTYEVEGLHPGYGHTLGNSLRRIILSSLPGTAVTLVKIEGAEHEYSTLSGIKEDVLGIVLNLKQVRFRSASADPVVIRLVAKGPQKVTAGMIDGGGTVEIANPDQYICEVTGKNGSLDIEMTVENGIGFVQREQLHKEKMPIGTIALDAIYTPIRKASYEVEDMRVGDRTDFNRLRVHIQTDGTMTPREALEQSVMIMLKQMRAILDLQEEERMIPAAPSEEEVVADIATDEVAETTSEDATDLLKTRVESLELSTRTANALAEANIRTIGGLVKKEEEDLLALDGIGDKGVEEIKVALDALGASLKEA